MAKIELQFEGDAQKFIDAVNKAAKSTGNLRREINVLRSGLNTLAASGASERTMQPLINSLRNANTAMRKLRDDTRGTGQFLDTFRGGIGKTILSFAGWSAAISGVSKLLRAAVENNKELKDKVDSLSQSTDRAAGAFGGFLDRLDTATGFMRNLNTEVSGFARLMEEDSVIANLLALDPSGTGAFLRKSAAFVAPKKGGDSPLDKLNKKAKEDRGGSIERPPRIDRLNEFVGENLLVDEEANLIGEAMESVMEKVPSFKAFLDEERERAMESQEARQMLVQWELDREKEKQELIDEGLQKQIDVYTNVIGPFQQAFEQSFLNSGRGFQKSMIRAIEAIIAKFASSAIFALIGSALGLGGGGGFGSIFKKLVGFADGGPTGGGLYPDPSRPGHRVAGVVHDGEYVVPRKLSSDPLASYYVAQLEAIRKSKRGFADGGFASAPSVVTPSIRNEVVVMLDGEQMYATMEREGKRKFNARLA